MIALYIWLSLLLPRVWGNTEKTIFLGPSPVDIGLIYSSLDYLKLTPLSPDKSVVRTYLRVEFPGNELRHGAPSWFILHDLTKGQRYEARVCWAATQPTAFKLETYELETVFAVPELKSELSAYMSTLHTGVNHHAAIYSQGSEPGIADSVLLLRVIASADFYTTNHTMMKDVPPILVDIILDPFLLNLLPRSLLSAVKYIVAVVVVSWVVGKWTSSWVRQIAAGPIKQKYR